jgi:hypothetical protein
MAARAYRIGLLPGFEQFARSADWRALPLRMQLALLHLERAETEAATKENAER